MRGEGGVTGGGNIDKTITDKFSLPGLFASSVGGRDREMGEEGGGGGEGTMLTSLFPSLYEWSLCQGSMHGHPRSSWYEVINVLLPSSCTMVQVASFQVENAVLTLFPSRRPSFPGLCEFRTASDDECVKA